MAKNNQNSGAGSNRGFAAMDPEQQREIASKGGQSVPPEQRSFSKDPRLASEAGRKGGEARGTNPRGGTSEQHAKEVSQDQKPT